MAEGTEPVRAGDTEQETRWLTADEQHAWMVLAGMMIKLPAALDAQLQRDAGLSTFEYFVLSGLSEAPGRRLRMSSLAEFVNGSQSRLSHVVRRLEQRGWIRREPCPGDLRSTNAVLTDAGWDKVVDTAPGHVETVRRLVIDSLTAAQTRQLSDIGTRVLEQINPDNTCGTTNPGC